MSFVSFLFNIDAINSKSTSISSKLNFFAKLPFFYLNKTQKNAIFSNRNFLLINKI